MKRSQTRLILICTTLFSLFSLLPPSSPLQAADFQIMERKAAPVHQGRRAEPAATPAIASPQSRTAPVRLKPAARRMEQLRRLPDLSITRFNATPAKVKSGGKIHLTALVKNSGNISLKGVVMRFTEAAHRKKLGEKVITIGPGKTSRVAITVSMTGKGQVTVLAEVDPKGRIAEGNERNNKKKTTVTIQPARMATVMERHPARAPTARPGRNVRIQEMQPGVTTKSSVSPTRRRIQPRPIVATKPDLAFVRLTSVRKQILQGQSVVVRATVRNNGSGNQHAVPVDFMLDGRKIGSRKVTIPANQTQTCIFRYTAAKSGNHSLVAKIDPGNRIKERNERNNSASIPIVVRPQQQIARSKAADSRNKATASATIATRAATPISIPRPINPAGRGRNLITLQKRSAETQVGSTSPSSRLHGRQAVTQTHKVARTSSTLSRRMQPSKLPVSRAGAENKELRKKGTSRTHNGPNMTVRGSKGSGSSSGDIGGLTAGGNPGGSGEPGAGQAPPPFEDDDGLGDIFGGKGTKRPNDKIITPDQMTGKVDTNSPAANLYGPGGKPLPGPGGVAGGRSHHGWRKVGSRKGESQAKHIASVLSIKGPGGQNAGKGALKTTVVKHKNGSLAVIFYHKDGPTIYIETRKGSRKWKCSIFFKAKTVTGSNESMNGSGDKGSKDPLSNSERRDIADARAAEVWNAVNNYTPIQSGGVIDPVRNQANGETGGQGSEKGKGQTGGKKAPRAAHAPGSHRPGSSLTGPGRMDRDPVGKQVKLPQGMHVVDPMAKNELSTGRVVTANKGNNAPVQTTKGNQTHTLIAPPGTVQLKHSSTGGNVAATPISIPRTADTVTRNKTSSTRVKQIKLDPGIGPSGHGEAQHADIIKMHHINKALNLPNPATYDSGPGDGAGPVPPGGSDWEHHNDKPIITFFDYQKIVHECSGLDITFYWKDGGKNLHDGKWTLEWQDRNGWTKKSGLIAKLPYPDDFHAVQGLCKYRIPFCEENNPTPFRFSLTDAAGLKGNVMTGIVNKHKGLQIITPGLATAADSFVFLAPAADQSFYRTYAAGMTIPVKFQLNMTASIKTVPVSITLEHGKQQSVLINNKKFVNNGTTKTLNLKLPVSLKEDTSCRLIATTSLYPNKRWQSGLFRIQKKGIHFIQPTSGSRLLVGDTVLLQWKTAGFPPSAKANIFVLGDGDRIIINTKPILVNDGHFSWTIKSGTFPTGQCELQLIPEGTFDQYGSGTVTIAYPKNIRPPSLDFDNPAPGRKTQWLAGGSEMIEWTQDGFVRNPSTIFYLESTDSSSSSHYYLGEIKPQSSYRKKAVVTVPAACSPGPYRVVAYDPALGKIGTSSIIEIVNPDKDMTPPPGTTFEISEISYPRAGGSVRVTVTVHTKSPFRLSSASNRFFGSQWLSCTISNYEYGGRPQRVGGQRVSIKSDTILFPKYILNEGSRYTIEFTPKMSAPLTRLITHKTMPSEGLFGAGKVCIQYYSPKLNIQIDTSLKNGKKTTSHEHIYLGEKTTSGIAEKTVRLPGEIHVCIQRDDRAW